MQRFCWSRRSLVAAFSFLLIAFTAGAHAADGEPMRLPVDESQLAVERDGETITQFDIEIADTSTEHARGLMFREDFPEGRGMLFVFETPRQTSFWMANTPRPLDIIFAEPGGRIITIAENTTPFSRDPIPSGGITGYVLEINAGLSERLGIETGDRLTHRRIGGQGVD